MIAATYHEIGSEFWDIPLSNSPSKLFSSGVQWFQSGRSALRAILRGRGWRTAALPSWCCESMIRPFAEAGLELGFYPALEPSPEIHADVALVMDYFGFAGTAARPGGQCEIIRDLTHSLFCGRPADAQFYFGSLRKWAGFWTGGYGWAADGAALPAPPPGASDFARLREMAMAQKASFIAEGGNDGPGMRKDHLETFARAEAMLDDSRDIAPAHPRDIDCARRLDAELFRRVRRRNAGLLLKAFGDLAVFPELKEGDCPLFVPVRVPKGRNRELQRFLASRGIFCPIHWPLSSLHALSPEMAEIYSSVLSLVCDQRYGEQEMLREIDTVKEFLERR